MKLCILGDTHFGARGDNLDFHTYFQKFYDTVFFPYLKENNIDTVFQMGDLFDRRKFINFNSLYLAKKYFFDKLKENNIKFYALLGNHDVSFRNTLEVNSPELLLREYDNIKLFRNFETVDFDGIKIDVVPWLCKENEEEIFNAIENSTSQICLGHFELKGFEMHKGAICDHGMEKEKLSRYDVVLSGHFHHKSSSDNITYVGVPYEMTWSDYNDPKGLHIFDTDTRELEFVKNPHNMFHKIFYDDDKMKYEEWKNFDYNVYKNCYLKIVVLNKQQPYLLEHILDNLYKTGCADISIVENFSELNLEADQEIIDQAEDTMTILGKYIDGLTLDIKNDKLKELMRELYVEALNSEIAE